MPAVEIQVISIIKLPKEHYDEETCIPSYPIFLCDYDESTKHMEKCYKQEWKMVIYDDFPHVYSKISTFRGDFLW